MSSIAFPEYDENLDDLPEVSVNDLLDAIRGLKMPKVFREPMVLESIVRGIRYHIAFAKSAEVAAAAERHDKIARARNARLIMSNEVPDEMLPEHVPPLLHMAPRCAFRRYV